MDLRAANLPGEQGDGAGGEDKADGRRARAVHARVGAALVRELAGAFEVLLVLFGEGFGFFVVLGADADAEVDLRRIARQ